KKNGVLLTISDLTGVKELEEKVRRADKLSALATMAAGMAHEIKNPLSSMKVLSQLLPIKYQDGEFRDKFIEIMPKEINRIDRIVESLLGFARATSPKYEKMKIEEVIEDDVKYYTDQAKAGGIVIETEYASLPEIMGDHDQLGQVFSNLILNAIQAMPDGGKLKIRTVEGNKIENLLQSVVIEISDTGHGISPQNMKKLFDPFFTTKYSGTGLGLTIVHNIVDGHRGTIDVSSEPGKGTAFTITLPVGQELI
ncbi:MAG TPA: ATP-binding protein, partial [Candidatus Omnitrophota bacterium]|nr:ATP-binding protein [Candidatus Omnitrophota bacterium]